MHQYQKLTSRTLVFCLTIICVLNIEFHLASFCLIFHLTHTNIVNSTLIWETKNNVFSSAVLVPQLIQLLQL